MQIIESLTGLPTSLSYPVMTIGVFDGVHRGHRFILEQLVKQAKLNQGTSILLTFTPHPQKVIAPDRAPRLLQTRQQKEAILSSTGIDVMLRLPFNRRLSLYTPREFAETILRNHGIREIHVGENFHFGHRRSGDIQTLASLGKEFEFQVRQIEPVRFRGHRVSSSRIRKQLEAGRVAVASRLLARPYQIGGVVVRGAGKGVELGFPTANLDVENELVPPAGVYVTQAHVNGHENLSVTNIGYRPTMEEETSSGPVVETHLLDFDGDLYGKSLELDFFLRLRPEKKFEGLEALKNQIARDAAAARRYQQRVDRRITSGS